MRLVTQNVSRASVTVDDRVVGEIGEGLLVLIGISDTDTEDIAERMLRKLLNLRIFHDENGKTNRSIQDIGGSLLMVSQFTLYADCRKGNRPSFVKAGAPEHARALYEYMIGKAKEAGIRVETGEFAAMMKVSLVNEGPFTIVLDSEEILR